MVAQKALSRLALLQGLVEGGDHVEKNASATLKLIVATVTRWMSMLPSLDKVRQNFSKLSTFNTVVSRNLAREVQVGLQILESLVPDMENIKSYASGNYKATNAIRDWISAYNTGTVSSRWKDLFHTTELMTMNQWMENVVHRLQFVVSLEHSLSSSNHVGLDKFVFHLGDMFYPEAFIIAIRQLTAQVIFATIMLAFIFVPC